MERKIIRHVQERISSRRLVPNPMIQHTVINLYIRYDYSSLHGCGEILDEKFEGTDGWKKTSIPPLFQNGGIISLSVPIMNLLAGKICIENNEVHTARTDKCCTLLKRC